jgi:ParB-like chromosome segregation protein Spo0J
MKKLLYRKGWYVEANPRRKAEPKLRFGRRRSGASSNSRERPAASRDPGEAGQVKFVRISRIRMTKADRAQLRPDKVEELAESMKLDGLINPLRTRPIPFSRDRRIVAGRHRFAAAEALGWAKIAVIDLAPGEDAKTIEITENLIRKDYTVLARAEAWASLSRHRKESAKRVSKRKLGPATSDSSPSGGSDTKSSDALRKSRERLMKIAGIEPEAKSHAVKIGLDDNQDALVEAAKGRTAADQIAKLDQRAARPRTRAVHRTTVAPSAATLATMKAKWSPTLRKAWAALPERDKIRFVHEVMFPSGLPAALRR